MATRRGKTIITEIKPKVISFASVVGKKEGQGPLAKEFDEIYEDTTMGEDSWEKAESLYLKSAISKAIAKSGIRKSDIDVICSGDLLSQCIGSSFGIRDFGLPFCGIYGACSTMALSLCMTSLMIETGAFNYCVAATSSHFCSAEKQFRKPLEYGGQRPPTAQWTVTGAGAVVLSAGGEGPRITHATVGKVVDMGVKDANNMGAAMAPAAADTIAAHLRETGRSPHFYDLIITGDLGETGSALLLELLGQEGLNLSNHTDCGCLIFDRQGQDVHSGGSGCGCCASVLTGHLLPGLAAGKWKNILFCPTGALHSPTATAQGESIPGISHAVAITSQER